MLVMVMAGRAVSPALSAGSSWCAGFLCFESIFTDRQIWRELRLLSWDPSPEFPLVSRSPLLRTWILEC